MLEVADKRAHERLRLDVSTLVFLDELDARGKSLGLGPAAGVGVQALGGMGDQDARATGQGEAFVAREVELAGTTNTQAAVVSGIQEGEEIALQPSLAAAVIH